MENKNKFNKIKIVDFMIGDLVSFAASKYGQEFIDYIDMTCGAIPQGEYETIIDPAAPKEFLELYTSIACKRLALTCSKIMELGPNYDRVLMDYFNRQCNSIGLKIPQTALETVEYLQQWLAE